MQRAEIFVAADVFEREGKAVIGVEWLRFEQAGGGRHRVRYVVLVAPSHRGAGLHGKGRRREGEIVDLDHWVLGTRRNNAGRGCRDQDRGAEEAAPRTADNVHDATGPKFQPWSG